MSSDKALGTETGRPPNWELPEITDVRIRAANYEPRPMRNFRNPLEGVKDAVEIVVYLEAPIPARAMGPILWVGKARLTESEPLDKEGKQLRFWAFDRTALREGAPIQIAWIGQQPAKRKQRRSFTYKLSR